MAAQSQVFHPVADPAPGAARQHDPADPRPDHAALSDDHDGVLAGVRRVITAAEPILYKIPFLQGPVDAFEGAVRGTVLPATQPVYGMGVVLALIFVGILAVNLIRDRFWCRYLCPLGGLLGLVSKVALLRRTVGDVCIECQRCARACPPAPSTSRAISRAIRPSARCAWIACRPARAAASISRGRPGPQPGAAMIHRDGSFSRRRARPSSRSACSGAEPAAKQEHAFLIRPPGARKPEFLSQCIRCGICLNVCPHPACSRA